VVVDNDGGGIFSFLPQAAGVAPATFERLWATPHGLDLAQVAAAYGIPVTAVKRLDEVEEALRREGGVRVIHARTDRERNVAIHRAIDQAVAAVI
jgi:2-succinyl-5-enolpyruvyl-6-hydroxy-3-cyclohexene-1-carboxylate synthase